MQHVPSDLDRDILYSMGWDVRAVPESGTFVLGAVGIVVLAYAGRRRMRTRA